MSRASQGMFLMGLACLIASFGLVSSCGDRGESAATPVPADPNHMIHVSTVNSTPVVVPANTPAGSLVRQITFTPNSAADWINAVIVEGTADLTTAGGGDSFRLIVCDTTGTQIGSLASVYGPGTGSGITYRLVWTPSPLDSACPATLGTMPSTSYTIKFTVATGSTWVGQINSTKFTIMTIDNMTASSTNISG